MTKKLYKILVDGKSCHGGAMKWDLPKNGKPGKWHTVEDELKICEKGLHLTTERFNWYKWGCTAYEAEAKDIVEWKEDKCVARSVRLLKEVKHPKWWNDTVSWIDTLKDIAWMKPDGKPKKEWKLFGTRGAAWDAAWDAAWNVARNAAGNAAWDVARDVAWNAAGNAAWNVARNVARNAARNAAWNAAGDVAGDVAGDAALYATGLIVVDRKLESKHRTHIKKRMEVWQKGYGLLCDVDGVLYVYETP